MTASQKFSSFTWILGFFGIWGLGKESLRFSFLTLPCTNPQGFWGCFLNISSTLLLSTLEASYHTPLFFSFLLFFFVKPQLVTNLQWITQNVGSPVVVEALYGTHLQPVVLFLFSEDALHSFPWKKYLNSRWKVCWLECCFLESYDCTFFVWPYRSMRCN